jgi:hypothetical protein
LGVPTPASGPKSVKSLNRLGSASDLAGNELRRVRFSLPAQLQIKGKQSHYNCKAGSVPLWLSLVLSGSPWASWLQHSVSAPSLSTPLVGVCRPSSGVGWSRSGGQGLAVGCGGHSEQLAVIGWWLVVGSWQPVVSALTVRLSELIPDPVNFHGSHCVSSVPCIPLGPLVFQCIFFAFCQT